ncbi:MAG: hypothetical protein QXS61_06860 [Candidatus Korarchaeum sp.]
MSWRRVAETLAKEASYRAGKEMGRGARNLSVVTAGSALRYNLFIILILTAISLTTGLSAFSGRDAALFTMIVLFLVEMMLGVLSMALNLQAIISDELLYPLQHLPIREDELRKALSLLGIYWGGLALPFAMIPAGLVSSVILADPSYILGFSSASICAMLLSMALGYLAGSVGGRYTRSVSRRAFSTIIWVILLGAGLMMNPILGRLSESLESSKELLEILAILPPISFLYMTKDLLSAISSLLSMALSLALLRIGTSRFWRIASSPVVEAPLKVATWGISFGSRAFLMRELKLTSRNPRMLASLLVYSFILPLFLIAPMLSHAGELEELRGVLPVIPMILGGLQGSFAPYYLYIMEAAGAKVLYILPMSRSRLASMKASSFLILTTPVSFGVTIAIIHLLGAPDGILSALFYVMALIGSTYLNSLAYAHMLPREPAHWSVETFSRWLIGTLMMIETVFYLSTFIIALILPSESLFLMIPYLAVIYTLSLLLAMRLSSTPL